MLHAAYLQWHTRRVHFSIPMSWCAMPPGHIGLLLRCAALTVHFIVVFLWLLIWSLDFVLASSYC